jgi:hypothetical protein
LVSELPERTHLGFNWAGWRLALIGVAVGTVLGLRMQIRFGGHATGGEAAFFILPVFLVMPIAVILLLISLATRPPRAYRFYAVAVGIAAWVTALTDGMPIYMLEPMTDEMFIVTILMWLTAALFVLTPFLKPRPVT